jgi:hypothetical protein
VKVIVRPVAALFTEPVGVVSVPEPSAATTVTLGDEPRFASELAEVDFACTCQVCAPLDEGAVAPEPPLPVFPYVIVKVEPPASVKEETVIIWLATETVPALAVVYPPLEPVVDGAFQPAGTTSVTEPLEMPPVAAVYVKMRVFPVEANGTDVVDVVSVPEPSAA